MRPPPMRGVHHQNEDRVESIILTSRCSRHFTISKKDTEKTLTKEWKPSHRREVVVRHASKA
jgi:hypothetical protein